MVGHCAPVCHCPSPATSFVSPNAPILDPGMIIAEIEDDERYKLFRYLGVAGWMFVGSLIAASVFWPDRHDLLIVAIVFSYCTAMVLLFLKHCDNVEEQQYQEVITPRECHETIWVHMLVVTGIMLISFVLTASNFPIKWGDVAIIAFFSLVATVVSFLLLIHWGDNREKELERKATYQQDLKKRKAAYISARSEETSTDLA